MTESLLEQQNDPAQYLPQLVGEGKKFSDTESLAKGKYEADLYVKVLERQLDTLRNDYIKEKESNDLRARVEDVHNQLTSAQQLASSAQPTANEVREKPHDARQLESLVASKVKEFDVQRKRDENFNLVKAQLQEQYGTNYQPVIDKAMKELELSADQVNELARTAPKAFFNTLGLNNKQQESFQTPPRSNQRSDFKPQGEADRTWAYYEDLHKKDKRAFYDPQTNVQMLKDAIRLGDKFKDGNYHAFGDT